MIVKPIPKILLPNSVSYQEYIPDTGEGATWNTAVTLSDVKIDEQKQFRRNSNGAEIVGNAMLYYDYVNSSGLTDKPTNESKVIYDGKTYFVVDTDILRANSDTPHHYEILLK
jgi:hypothetical protein